MIRCHGKEVHLNESDYDSNNCSSKVSFKQQLTNRANSYEQNIDISKDIEYIKKRMNDWCFKRCYTVTLIRASTVMAIGSASSNSTSLFIPEQVSPTHYRQLFVDEFKKLGFKETDIELYSQYDALADYHNIKLTW